MQITKIIWSESLKAKRQQKHSHRVNTFQIISFIESCRCEGVRVVSHLHIITILSTYFYWRQNCSYIIYIVIRNTCRGRREGESSKVDWNILFQPISFSFLRAFCERSSHDILTFLIQISALMVMQCLMLCIAALKLLQRKCSF